jgi:chemosensory pili system protein ChpA (sensor histidine kinase/response regulator)
MIATPTLNADLMDAFLAEAWETISDLERAGQLIHTDARRLSVAAHRLRGSAGLYQHPELSGLAGLLERIFETSEVLDAHQRQLALDFTAQATAVMTEALERIQMTGQEGEVGLALAALGGGALLEELLRAGRTEFRRAHLAPAGNRETQSDTSSELRQFFQTNAEVWEYFAPEVLEHLEAVTHSVETLDPRDPREAVQVIFRGMHTIKGASYSVGCTPLGALAHRLEDLLVLVRDTGQPWSERLTQTTLEGVDALSRMLQTAEGREVRLAEALRTVNASLDTLLGSSPTPVPAAVTTPQTAPQPDHPATPASATTPSSPETAPETPAATIRVNVNRLDSVMNLSGEVLLTRARLERLSREYAELSELLEASRQRLFKTSTEFSERYANPRFNVLDEDATPLEGSVQRTQLAQNVREVFSELEFDRYDDLSLLSRGVQEMTADLSEIGAQLEKLTRDFRRETEGFEKLTRSLRLEAGRLRLVPVGRFYQRLRRQVRQTAQSTGKNVRLELSGENVEVDNLVLESLADSLIHLVNNAVVHGVEDAQVRQRRGKGSDGVIRLNARRRGNSLILEVQDDGNGIDVEAVKRKAVERGLRTQAEVDALNVDAANELIFLPGLSTAPSVSDRAGRGVGMDVVFAAIRRLKGTVSIQSEPGFGTRFTLKIPASLIVSDILGFTLDGDDFAVPGEAVRALRSVTEADLVLEGNTRYFDYQGERLEVVYLADVLGLPRAPASKRFPLMVLENDSGRTVYQVDAFTGLEQAVVRPLEEPFTQIAHLSGATVNAEGRVVMLLEPDGLLRLERGEVSAPVFKALPVARRRHVLLVDDSLSVRKVVSAMLTRLGANVSTAGDGQEALDLLLTGSEFDAIITDLEMPRLSGFELVDELRRRPTFAKLPVAMLTTRASDKHREFALALGVNEYFSKPIDDTRLARWLERLEHA